MTNDGQDALINNVNGGFKDYPVEVYESKYPVILKRYGFRPDTMRSCPNVVVNPGREDEQHMLKINTLPVDAGDVVRLNTGGGGGFGNPWERDPERHYGVVLKEDLSIDEEATQKRRKAMKAKG